MEFLFVKLPGLESPGNDFGPGNCWKFKLKVLESPQICWDIDAMMRMQTRKYSHLVLMICYSD